MSGDSLHQQPYGCKSSSSPSSELSSSSNPLREHPADIASKARCKLLFLANAVSCFSMECTDMGNEDFDGLSFILMDLSKSMEEIKAGLA